MGSVPESENGRDSVDGQQLEALQEIVLAVNGVRMALG